MVHVLFCNNENKDKILEIIRLRRRRRRNSYGDLRCVGHRPLIGE
jgi:hypothetical protein